MHIPKADGRPRPLGVTVLEDYFDVRLFRRLTRALRLTDAGQAVLPVLQEGFDKLAQADRVVRNRQDDRILTVSVAPSFGAKGLVPRLDRFHRTYPDYDVRLDATRPAGGLPRAQRRHRAALWPRQLSPMSPSL